MIREISWYLDDGRFASLARELENAVRAYAAVRGGDPGKAPDLREEARRLFERHCVQSGLRDAENSFINIDAEFFDGAKINEAALEYFIGNIIKAHCYQKVLWTYMGTTGSLTPITKTEMRRAGLRFESLLPVSCRLSRKPRSRACAAGNTVALYLYADGKAGAGYIPEKAFHRFDVLEDTSGVNWNKGYDPAGTIAKNGWHGVFDSKGVWTRIDERSGARDGRGAGNLLVVRDGENAILYDPENILVSPAALFYFTEAGESRGRPGADIEKTAGEIRGAMEDMGVSHIKEIACAAAASPETAAAYRAVLKDLISPALVLSEAASLFARIDENRGAGEKQKAGTSGRGKRGRLSAGGGAADIQTPGGPAEEAGGFSSGKSSGSGVFPAALAAESGAAPEKTVKAAAGREDEKTFAGIPAAPDVRSIAVYENQSVPVAPGAGGAAEAFDALEVHDVSAAYAGLDASRTPETPDPRSAAAHEKQSGTGIPAAFKPRVGQSLLAHAAGAGHSLRSLLAHAAGVTEPKAEEEYLTATAKKSKKEGGKLWRKSNISSFFRFRGLFRKYFVHPLLQSCLTNASVASGAGSATEASATLEAPDMSGAGGAAEMSKVPEASAMSAAPAGLGVSRTSETPDNRSAAAASTGKIKAGGDFGIFLTALAAGNGAAPEKTVKGAAGREYEPTFVEIPAAPDVRSIAAREKQSVSLAPAMSGAPGAAEVFATLEASAMSGAPAGLGVSRTPESLDKRSTAAASTGKIKAGGHSGVFSAALAAESGAMPGKTGKTAADPQNFLTMARREDEKTFVAIPAAPDVRSIAAREKQSVSLAPVASATLEVHAMSGASGAAEMFATLEAPNMSAAPAVLGMSRAPETSDKRSTAAAPIGKIKAGADSGVFSAALASENGAMPGKTEKAATDPENFRTPAEREDEKTFVAIPAAPDVRSIAAREKQSVSLAPAASGTFEVRDIAVAPAVPGVSDASVLSGGVPGDSEAPPRSISLRGVSPGEKGFSAGAAEKAEEFFHDICLREDFPSPGFLALSAAVDAADLSQKSMPRPRRRNGGVRRLVPVYRGGEWKPPEKRIAPLEFPEAPGLSAAPAEEFPRAELKSRGDSEEGFRAAPFLGVMPGPPFRASLAAAIPGASPASARQPQRNDAELERLRRIEANYERDKALLAREKQPLLARSIAHDMECAEWAAGLPAESDAFAIKRMNAKFGRLIKEALNESI